MKKHKGDMMGICYIDLLNGLSLVKHNQTIVKDYQAVVVFKNYITHEYFGYDLDYSMDNNETDLDFCGVLN